MVRYEHEKAMKHAVGNVLAQQPIAAVLNLADGQTWEEELASNLTLNMKEKDADLRLQRWEG